MADQTRKQNVSRSDIRIVAADDDPQIRSLLGAILTRAGYDVRLAASGAEAIALTHEVLPALVILDYMMPDLDGGRVAAVLKAAEASKDIPILLVSGLDDLPEAPASDGTQPWDYRAVKPFTPAQLKALIAEIVGAPAPESVTIDEPAHDDASTGAEIVRPMRQGYLDSLKETIAQLQAELVAGTSGEDTRQALDTMRRRFHQIRGSAATFGFPSIGEVAAEAEGLVRRWQLQVDSDRVDAVPDLSSLSAAVERISALLQKAASSQSGVPQKQVERADASPACSILLLHHDETLCESAVSAARKRGYEIEAYRSGAAAVERLRERSFTIVTIGGAPARQPDCEWVRAIQTVSGSAAIVLVGGDGSMEHRVTAAKAGVARYLAAAVDVDRLLQEWEDLAEGSARRAGRVLAVDDDPMIREFVSRQLRAWGCEVVCAEDAVDVFDRLDEVDPDLLLLDVDMPSSNGLEVAKAIRSSDRWRDLPVVIATAHTSAEYRLRAFESGADDFISKPLLEEELRARVVGRLERERTKRDLARTDPVTGLFGREDFTRKAAMTRSAWGTCALATIELEGLVEFTRRYGLEAGDAALHAVATALRMTFRSARDVLGRVGADVIAVVASGADKRELAARLEACFGRLEDDLRLSPSGNPREGVALEASVVSANDDDAIEDVLARSLRARRPAARGRVTVAGVSPASAPACVYLVEDDDNLRELVAFMLRNAGYRVCAIDGGTEAIRTLLAADREHASRERPVVLLDVDLPDVDGFGVLRELVLHRPGCFRVIMLTANDNPGDRMRGLRSGAVDYLAKPIKIPALLGTVRRILNESSPRADGPDEPPARNRAMELHS